MKEIAICIAFTLLGIFIFGLVIGEDENTIQSTVGNLWTAEIKAQNTYP